MGATYLYPKSPLGKVRKAGKVHGGKQCKQREYLPFDQSWKRLFPDLSAQASIAKIAPIPVWVPSGPHPPPPAIVLPSTMACISSSTASAHTSE